jgi:hypothetical protein
MKRAMLWMAAAILFAGRAANAALILGDYIGTFTNSDLPPGGSLVLTVSSQTPNGSDFDIGGYTDVECDVLSNCHGRLLWTGTLFSTNAISFADYDVVPNALGPPLFLDRAAYTGVLAGNTISGTWTFLAFDGGGTFSVTAAPEPATLSLIAAGLSGLGLFAFRRRPRFTAIAERGPEVAD